MICENLKAVREIGLLPTADDTCNEPAAVMFSYGPWHMCKTHSISALYAGLTPESMSATTAKSRLESGANSSQGKS